MFLLRRSAVRAISATPAKAFLATPRSLSTFTPAFRTQQKWAVSAFQRRFASDDVVKKEVAAEAPEDFAQTIAEPMTEDGLTPVQQDAQAEPTNAEETVGADALEAVAKQADRPKREFQRREKSDAPPNNTVYVGNLYYEVTADQVKRVFSRFGEVNNVRIVLDNRGLSRGFGYVEFKNIEDAKTAIDNLDMQVFEGRNIVCQFHKAKPNSKTLSAGSYVSNPPAKTLFIGNMSFEMSDKDLNDIFRDIRNVMDVRVAIDRRTGQPRGFAHADFIDVASATKAKETLGEKVIYGRQLRVDFSRSSTDRPDRATRSDSAQEGQ
ncbi:RNA-binding domain-containing protein [Didymella exigua CBS 183.55]|uniref:RNA-binding domain-containing protein n=1 Tax=Didymella exigua CBS 183.55 TaxID=1150837 RepID=A0A6A5RY17_9PLEO|nr:RNA-binding domain-containing protein [Didymella exigua CBS 183.55]KAF1932503.1 RNA-binding domain-containing protein [Didymella exigua CBS 183.55]